MYLGFYGLTREPFHVTPDPRFLFLSPSHKEAFAAVVYGVKQRKGFITLTGEVGTGKTTVLRAYLKKIDRQEIRPIYLFNPDLSFHELMQVLLHELGLETKGLSSAMMLHWFHWALVEEFRQNRNVVLIIDEAQNMPVETLENIRMLSNIETTREKLLQVVLVGQPELETKLDLHQLRQLKQRIAVRATIRPLRRSESFEYIEHRLGKAGGSGAFVFTRSAMRAIVGRAQGIPRFLNILCDNALITGFGSEERPVTAKTVRQAAADLRRSARRRRLNWAWASAAALLLVTGVLAMPLLGHATRDAAQGTVEGPRVVHAETPPSPTPPSSPAQAAAAAPEPAARPSSAPGHREVALDLMLRLDAASPTQTAEREPAALEPPSRPIPTRHPWATELFPADLLSEARIVAADALEAPAPVKELAGPATDEGVVPPEMLISSAKEVKRVAKWGDNLTRLTTQVYGFTSPDLIEWVKDSNPSIENVDRVLAGATIVFPELGSTGADAPPAPAARQPGGNGENS